MGSTACARITLDAGGLALSGIHVAAAAAPRGLIFGIHGGSYTSRYFDFDAIRGSNLVDVAPALGYAVVAVDRPGYGAASEVAVDFAEQATMLAAAASDALARFAPRAAGIILSGHSIGAMLSMLVAADHAPMGLLGVDLIGAGLDNNPIADTALRRIASQSSSTARPVRKTRTQRMFGPDWSYSPATADEDWTHAPYSRPHEIREAMIWGRTVTTVAPRIRVPVQIALAEHDAIWLGTPDVMQRLGALFTNAPFVESRVQRLAGHCSHLHDVGRACVLRTVAFADECIKQAGRRPIHGPS
ncbi:MAG: alpha/beta hydrolase [Burkholderiales bacterium]|nr:alpha/beta hydrolase [Burkholderiales bacterium]